MKNIFKFISVFMLMIGGLAFGQSITRDGLLTHQTVQKEAQRYGIICYLETQNFYKNGMSEEEFTENVLAYQFDNGERPEAYRKFLSSIYRLHAMRADNNTVYDNVDVQSFVDFANSNLRNYKRGATKEENLSVIFTDGKAIPKPKHGWLNLGRKILDILDDEFRGK